MRERFCQAFESIHATQQMKESACAFVQAAVAGSRPKRRPALGRPVVCCAMLALVLCGIGGYRFYQTPVSYISVDVNPSIELSLNRLDRVVRAAAYQDNGAAILQNLRLKNMVYTEAIELLLADDDFESYLTEDALLSFTVVSDKEDELLSGIQQCHGYAQVNAECHSASAQLVEDAHHNDLSFGKYQAFLELTQYDDTITAEDCKDLSMRQIRDLIRQHRVEQSTDAAGETVAGQDHGHHGNRNGCRADACP